MSLEWLFQPIPIGSERASSRLFLAPINTGFGSAGRPTQRLLRFHAKRANPSVGVSIVGNVATRLESRTNPRTLVLSTSSDVARFAVVARAIERQGSIPVVQLAETLPELDPQRGWRAAKPHDEVERLRRIVEELPAGTIDQSMGAFVESARLAAVSRFRGIQIHAAHGYLLSLLLHPEANRRTDRYGASGSWMSDLVARLRAAIGMRILAFRISGYVGLGDAAEEAAVATEVARGLVSLGVDWIDLSAGWYTLDRRMIYPSGPPTLHPNRDLAEHIAASVRAVVSFAGNVVDLRDLRPLRPNVAILIGRAMIADPQFAAKSRAGRFDDIVACVRHNHCHYFSRGRPSLECGANPEI